MSCTYALMYASYSLVAFGAADPFTKYHAIWLIPGLGPKRAQKEPSETTFAPFPRLGLKKSQNEPSEVAFGKF